MSESEPNPQFEIENLLLKLKELEALITDLLAEQFELEESEDPKSKQKIERLGRTLRSLDDQKSEISNKIEQLKSSTKKKDEPLEPRPVILKGGKHYQYLANPENGRQLSRPYKKIVNMDEVLIAESIFGWKCILDPETGKELSPAYEDIFIRDGLIIGIHPTGSEFLLKRNGKRASSTGYHRIEKRSQSVIGIHWEDGPEDVII